MAECTKRLWVARRPARSPDLDLQVKQTAKERKRCSQALLDAAGSAGVRADMLEARDGQGDIPLDCCAASSLKTLLEVKSLGGPALSASLVICARLAN